MYKLVLLFSVLVSSFSPVLQADSFDFKASVELEKLAAKSKMGRKVGGGFLVAYGGVSYLALQSFADDERRLGDVDSANGAEAAAAIFGLTSAGIGALMLMVQSKSENAWQRSAQFEDLQVREQAAYTEIKMLAHEKKIARIISGSLNVALAVLDARLRDSRGFSSFNIIFGALGVSQLLIPSSEERALSRVDGAARNGGSEIALGLGVNQSLDPLVAIRFAF